MIPFARVAPAASVAHLVDHYRIRVVGTPVPVPVQARAAHALQFYLDDPYEAEDLRSGMRSSAPAVTLVGARTDCRETIAARGSRMRVVSVQFRPGALHRLTRVGAGALVDRAVDASLLFGRGLTETLERLRESDLTRAGDVLDAYFAPLASTDAHVADRIAALLVERPSLAIESLAAEAGLSRRQLERAFLTRMGIGPKRYARIARFERAQAAFRRTRAPWTRIAHECGYSDQAHLIRDFREFGGAAPGKAMSHSFNDRRPRAATIES